MHAYLIIGNNHDEAIRALNLSGKIIEFPLAKIDDVREIARFTKFTLSEKTIVLVNNFGQAGEEAQNAFLKALEEPQENLTYVLTATNIDGILPTIVSRCEVIELIINNIKLKIEDKTRAKDFLDAKLGEKLKIISKIAKRDEAIEFINKLIVVGHQEKLNNPSAKFQILDEALKTIKNLEANGNVQLQLTNFVVNLDH